RAVFVEMISTPENRAIVTAVGEPASELNPILAARRLELCPRPGPRRKAFANTLDAERRTPTAADIAALLFAESPAPPKYRPPVLRMSGLIYGSEFAATINKANETGQVYRAIVAAWLDTRHDALDMHQALTIATSLSLKEECCRLAARLFLLQGAPAYAR